MRTPPVTKLKGDLLLELREVNLQIATAKSELEALQNKIIEASKGFEAREKKIKELENNFPTVEKKYNDNVEELKKTVKTLEKNIGENTATLLSIQGLKTKEVEELYNVLEQKEKVESDLFELKTSVNKDLTTVNKQIEEKKVILHDLMQEISDALNNLEELENKENAILLTQKEREEELSKREKQLETMRSDIRILSVRFHKKYGDVVTEGQRIATTV